MGESTATSRNTTVDVKLSYLPQLDGLRAVAVALVVIHHLLQPAHFGGWIGIDVFFVLSGYLITSLLRVEINRTGRIQLRRFYARRLLRLYPPLIVAVALLAPLGLALYPSRLQYIGSSGMALTYTTNLVATALNQWVGPWTHTWTLALEEQFYLIWPLVLLVAVRLRWKTPIVGAALLATALLWLIVVSTVSDDPISSGYNPLLQGAPLLGGCGLALSDQIRGWTRSVGAATVGIALLILAVVLGSTGLSQLISAIPATLGSLLLIGYLSTSDGLISRALSVPPLVGLGKVSYEVYLWHYPLMVLSAILLPSPALVAGVVVIGSVGLALLSHRFVSTPLNRVLKPRLEYIKA